MNEYYVYIATNRSRTLYTGVTNNLQRREVEHQEGRSSFTGQYRIDHVVYYEAFNDIHQAIAREKQIKGWRRSKKIALIESTNPNWKDAASAPPAREGRA